MPRWLGVALRDPDRLELVGARAAVRRECVVDLVPPRARAREHDSRPIHADTTSRLCLEGPNERLLGNGARRSSGDDLPDRDRRLHAAERLARKSVLEHRDVDDPWLARRHALRLRAQLDGRPPSGKRRARAYQRDDCGEKD